MSDAPVKEQESTPAGFAQAANVLFERLLANWSQELLQAELELAVRNADRLELYTEHGTEGVAGEGPRSLLELGFVPSFFHFREAVLTTKLSVSIVDEKPKFRTSVTHGDPSSLLSPMGLSATPLGAVEQNKFSFPPEHASSLQARLTSVPPPNGLLDKLRKP
jgi:hypothetical protein